MCLVDGGTLNLAQLNSQAMRLVVGKEFFSQRFLSVDVVFV